MIETTRKFIVQCFCIFLFLLFLPACQFNTANSLNIITSGASFGFQIEIADTRQLRKLGLMYRKELAHDAAMLFEYEKERKVSMWMKNTYIPLDIIFINKDGIIRHIHENARPMSEEKMRSTEPVKAVLEINAGLVEKYGIKKGDRVEHGIFNRFFFF